MKQSNEIGILGAGGMAREAAAYSLGDVKFFAVNEEYIGSVVKDGIDIKNPSTSQAETGVVAAIGAPAARRVMVEAWPGRKYVSIIADSAEVYTGNIGKGVIIGPGAFIMTGVEIGNHTIINISATVSHDCKLGDYVTISPGAHIAGNVTMRDGVFVGIGATVSNDICIADGVVVGAGAVVVKDITVPNSVVIGNPAKTIRIQEGWLNNV